MNELENYLNTEEPKTELEILSQQLYNGDKITLYKLDSNGKSREWNINVVKGEVSTGEAGIIFIETGLVDGKKVEQEPIIIAEGKNLGKANATTPFTQALAEAKSKIEQQLRSGYVRNLADVKASGTLGSGIPQPLLAQKYHPTGAQKGSKTLEKMKLVGKKIHVQPKLDGNRCLIKLTYTEDKGVTGEMYTRKGDLMPVQLAHVIDEAVRSVPEVGTELILDGELFSDELSFNELNGHLKRKDSQDAEALKKIKYHIYDVMLPWHEYGIRYQFLKDRFKEQESIIIVPSFELEATDDNIKEKLEEFLAEGHEGLMIRTLDKGYENKRSWQLVKVKLFEDAEFEILDLEQDAMGRLGKFIMKLPEPVTDRDGKIVTDFKAGLTGIDHETGYKMLAEKHKYIGKMATIEFFGWDIRPRFPKFKGIREDI